MVRVWMDDGNQPARDLVAGSAGASAAPLAPGPKALTDQAQSWSLRLDAPGVVAVVSEDPGVIGLSDGDTVLDVRTASTSAFRHLVRRLPAGTYTLAARPLAGQPRTGVIRYHLLEPELLEPSPDEPARLIRPGEIQAWRFTVSVKGNIGVGVRADTDRLDAWLTDMDNRILARGPLMFRELPPGDYLLLVAGGDAPVQYRPVVLGTAGSRRGIPDDVLENYVKEERQ
jgi:hypothetical protein